MNFSDALEEIKKGNFVKRQVVKNNTVIIDYKNRLYHFDRETGIRYPYSPSNADLMSIDWQIIPKTKDLIKYDKTINELLKDNSNCPVPLHMFHNNMGINLVSVDRIKWGEKNGNLKYIHIYFNNNNEITIEKTLTIKEYVTAEKIIDEPSILPMSLSIFPDILGINLSSIDTISWEMDNELGIKEILIEFIKENDDDINNFKILLPYEGVIYAVTPEKNYKSMNYRGDGFFGKFDIFEWFAKNNFKKNIINKIVNSNNITLRDLGYSLNSTFYKNINNGKIYLSAKFKINEYLYNSIILPIGLFNNYEEKIDGFTINVHLDKGSFVEYPMNILYDELDMLENQKIMKVSFNKNENYYVKKLKEPMSINSELANKIFKNTNIDTEGCVIIPRIHYQYLENINNKKYSGYQPNDELDMTKPPTDIN